MSKVFLPLYSNMPWFTDEESVTRLERQIKSHLILYDELYLEDGKLQFFASADGQGMQFHRPSDSISEARSGPSFFSPGQRFGIQFLDPATGKNVNLLSAQNEHGYEVDFYPVLSKAGLLNAPFVKRIEIDLGKLKNGIEEKASRLYSQPPLRRELPRNSYLARQMLFGLIRDTTIAADNKMSLSACGRLLPAINAHKMGQYQKWNVDIPAVFFDHWLELEFPDLTSSSWEDVCSFRESVLGQSFRTLVRDMKSRAFEFLQTGPSKEDIRYWVAKDFTKELAREVQSRLQSPAGVAMNLCLNFIPYSSFMDTAQELLDCVHDRTSWVSIAKKKPDVND